MQTKLQFATWNLTAWTNETGSYSNWTTYFNSGRISFLHSFFETDGEVETAYKTVKIGKYGGVKFSIEIEGWAMQVSHTGPRTSTGASTRTGTCTRTKCK
jgi:hypothetical protein